MDPTGDVFSYLKNMFDWSYEGNRAPVPLYVHAPWFTYVSAAAAEQAAPCMPVQTPALCLSGTPSPECISNAAWLPRRAARPQEHANATKAFIEYALTKPNTYFVTMSQLVKYMRAPVAAADAGSVFTCKPVQLTPPGELERRAAAAAIAFPILLPSSHPVLLPILFSCPLRTSAPPPAPPPPSPAANLYCTKYAVQAGETLAAIGARFKVPGDAVSALLEVNPELRGNAAVVVSTLQSLGAGWLG